MKGLIFSVKRYSVHDGPGIRVTFFLKGCSLNCRWCHNPEGISPFPQEVEQTRKIGDQEFSEMITAGENYSISDITGILRKEDVFIKQSGGGVTFSGGEPMLQPEFLLAALKESRQDGYHTAVDTSGFAAEDLFRSVVPFTDLFLFDLKHLDEERHIELTGVSNRLILSNYMFLLNSGKDMIVRIPVIPGCNDDPEHLERLRYFLKQTRRDNLKKICLLPFHKTGSSKYTRFGREYIMGDTEQPSSERMMELKNYFSETGISTKIGG